MEYRALGQTGLSVSAVSFGTGPLGEMYEPMTEAEAMSLVDETIDLGVNSFDTSPYYGTAEYRLGKALTPSKREKIVLATKAGRYGVSDFDFSPERMRASLERSLKTMNTDYVDIFYLHDIEFVSLDSIFAESYNELVKLKEEGKCRAIGMSGYPIKTFTRVITETEVDVVLTYAKGTLLDDSITTELKPLADAKGVGLINAAAVALGLLTPQGGKINPDHQAPIVVQEAAKRMVELARERGIDVAFLANQYAIQRTGTATTMAGIGNSSQLHSAVDAASTPIDEFILQEFLALRPPAGQRQWRIGMEENN